MAAVVLGACFLARAYFEQHGSTPRAGTLPVAVAGTVRPIETKAAPIAAINIDSADRIVDGPLRSAARPSAEAASPLIPVTASSKDSTRQSVIPERSIAKKPSTHGAKQSVKTSKAKPVSKSASACSRKSERACAEAAKGRVSRTEPKQRQTRAAPPAAPAARAKTDTKEFQKVAAIAPAVKPAMTADDSWRPSKKKN